MHKLKQVRNIFLPPYEKRDNIVIVVTVVLLIVLPLVAISSKNMNFFSRAAGVSANELEDGTLAGGATIVNDASASGGRYVQLGSVTASAPCTGTAVDASMTRTQIQTLLTNAATNTTFCFAAGEYRIDSALAPKAGQQLIGAKGADLNGSVLLTSPQTSGSNYVFNAQLPSSPTLYGSCASATPLCNYAQDVFWDDQVMTRATSSATLATGKYYADYPNNKIYVFDNPAGHKVEQAKTRYIVSSAANNITIRGFVVEKAASMAQDGTINGHVPSASGWTVEYNEVRFNHGVGISADASIVRNNYVHHNGQMGLAGGSGAGGLIENNELAFNNAAGYDVLWEAGGAKFVLNTNLDVKGNYSHDNKGPGLWCDINCHNAIFENNTVVNNPYGGIFYEICFDGIIRNNLLMNDSTPQRNGFYAPSNILVSASPNTEVYGNTSYGGVGIGILQQNRPDSPDPEGSHSARNVFIHDNVFITSSSTLSTMAGLSQDVGDTGYFTSYNNRYVHNTYHLPNNTSNWFTWNNGDRPISYWTTTGGQDTTGTFDTNVVVPTIPPGPPVGPNAMP